MSNFFDFARPKMLDMKKKLNFVMSEKSDEPSVTATATSAAAAAAAPSLTTSLNPFVTPMTDSAPAMSESWVELAPSRTSLCSSVDINMVMVDDKDKDSRLSPVSMQSPHVEFESLEQVKYKLVREMLPPGKNTDWIWDWSSRPEHIPAKWADTENHGGEMKNVCFRTVRMRQYGSNLTTPPNSPEPELYHYLPYEAEPYFNVRVVFGFIVSNLFSFVVGAAVGFAVCRKIAKHREL